MHLAQDSIQPKHLMASPLMLFASWWELSAYVSQEGCTGWGGDTGGSVAHTQGHVITPVLRVSLQQLQPPPEVSAVGNCRINGAFVKARARNHSVL